MYDTSLVWGCDRKSQGVTVLQAVPGSYNYMLLCVCVLIIRTQCGCVGVLFQVISCEFSQRKYLIHINTYVDQGNRYQSITMETKVLASESKIYVCVCVCVCVRVF